MSQLGILSNDQAAIAARLEEEAADRKDFLTGLVQKQWLTSLQAVQLGRGRGHHLSVGGYVLYERLGAGGMGRVFLARHPGLNRFAAIKLVRLDRRHCPITRVQFLREVQIAARLNHANVIHAHDAGMDHRAFFLVMEYVPGPDLARLVLSEGPLEVGRACEYARQALLGLQHMHDQGIIHRDVKPSNLGLARGGRVVKVLDVGLARVRTEGEPVHVSRRRKLLGSADYAAPEQFGSAHKADARADVYALGCTLYHLLAGRVPFPGGTSAEKVQRHLTRLPRPIETRRPDLPAGLGDVIRQMMARRRKHRYQSAAEAIAALAPYATPFTDQSTGPAQPNNSIPTMPTTVDQPTTAGDRSGSV